MNQQSPTNQSPATCEDDYDPASLNIHDAHQRIRQLIYPVTETETVSLDQALNRTLAQDIPSTINVPPQTNSAMDGYGLKFKDIDAPSPPPLRIIGSAYAGKLFPGDINHGECIRQSSWRSRPTSGTTIGGCGKSPQKAGTRAALKVLDSSGRHPVHLLRRLRRDRSEVCRLIRHDGFR